MPELPDILLYLNAFERHILNHRMEKIQLRSPFLLRSVDSDLESLSGRTVSDLLRLGKRIVWCLEHDTYLVFYLMIAGRFHWRKPGAEPRSKADLAAFHFHHGTVMLTEQSPKKRAALHVVRGKAELSTHRREGIEVLECNQRTFAEVLTRENYTLKRALTDPRLFSGIGNAYSDEILHTARLSPLRWTAHLAPQEIVRLFEATQSTLQKWIRRLLDETGDSFPRKVTAFREGMAVHGRYKEPCPVCSTGVQLIVYAEHQTNYCPRCQTEGRVLADRALSRLLRKDWPRTIEEWESAR